MNPEHEHIEIGGTELMFGTLPNESYEVCDHITVSELKRYDFPAVVEMPSLNTSEPSADSLPWEEPLSPQSDNNDVVAQGEELKKFLEPVRQPWTEDLEMCVNAPYQYLASYPGKDVRKKILSAYNVWLKVDESSLEVISRVVSMLHNASLLIDDIQDGSSLRRGVPTAHQVHGIASTINSGNYVYFKAQQELMSLDNALEMIKIFNEELINLHRGQGLDIYWRDSFTVPTEEEYLKMIANKTGGLFRLAVRLMTAASPTSVDMTELTEVLGLLFQIQDDYKNLTSSKARPFPFAETGIDLLTAAKMSATKGYCEDLSEGKFSYPIIHAVRNSPSHDRNILNILKLKTQQDHLKAYVVSQMQEVTGSLEYTRLTIQTLYVHATRLMNELETENKLMQAILNSLGVLE